MKNGASTESVDIPGTLLAQITEGITQIKAEYYGRGAPEGKSYVNDNMLFTVLSGGLTDLEQTLLDRGRGDEVRRLRMVFQEEMREEYVQTVERVTGRRVRDYFSQFLIETRLTVEVFVLDTAPVR
jgi:uncharacterized protein YbcI